MTTNKSVFDFLKANGKAKCLDFVKENFLSRSTSSSEIIQPTDKAFQYSLKKVSDKIEKLNKSKSRAHVADAEINKRGPQTSVEESLDFKAALVNKKLNNQILAKENIETKNLIQTRDCQMTNSTKKVERLKLNLKRTSSRESYALKKIQK